MKKNEIISVIAIVLVYLTIMMIPAKDAIWFGVVKVFVSVPFWGTIAVFFAKKRWLQIILAIVYGAGALLLPNDELKMMMTLFFIFQFICLSVSFGIDIYAKIGQLILRRAGR